MADLAEAVAHHQQLDEEREEKLKQLESELAAQKNLASQLLLKSQGLEHELEAAKEKSGGLELEIETKTAQLEALKTKFLALKAAEIEAVLGGKWTISLMAQTVELEPNPARPTASGTAQSGPPQSRPPTSQLSAVDKKDAGKQAVRLGRNEEQVI